MNMEKKKKSENKFVWLNILKKKNANKGLAQLARIVRSV